MRSEKRAVEYVAELCILLFAFLLPLKYGTFGVIPEAGSFFPGGLFEYLIISWPASSFGVVGGAVLLLCLWAWGREMRIDTALGKTALLWGVALPLCSFLGFINCSGLDFAVLQSSHFFNIGTFFLAVWLYCGGRGHAGRIFIALACGTLLLCWMGIEQYFWGFAESRNFVLQQEAQGIPVHIDIKNRAFDTRVYATFTSCNSLAGYLLLLWAPVAVFLWQCGNRVEPEKVSRVLFAGLGGAAALTVLLLTKSRAGYLALLGGAVVLTLCWPMRRRWKITVILAAVAAVCGGAYYIYLHGRGFESMAARLDYIRSSLLLFSDYPIFGAGWGEFFYKHMQIKSIVSHEAAHDPHNILLTAMQGGILMLAAMSAAMFYPLYKLVRMAVLTPFRIAVIFGVICMYLHSLMDTNVQIPAVMAALAVVFAAAFDEKNDAVTVEKTGRMRKTTTIGLALIAILTLSVSFWTLRGEVAYERLQGLCLAQGKSLEDYAKVRPDEVMEAWREAVRWRPYSTFVYSLPADYFMARGQFADAKDFLLKSLRLAPQRAALYKRLAIIALHDKDAAAAKKFLIRAHELFPHHPDYALPHGD